ncbi:DUF2259 domain-containing protein [Pelagibacterium montanilacus]|uniref:DUF2259 domain-containing protein n=1 Tax=Pelagibacterium montanilacus TaxID=2185280 RepID=UPI000F8F811B|nr:DUF2259 domain-containing protein [Pelagibacterium montanilacus]
MALAGSVRRGFSAALVVAGGLSAPQAMAADQALIEVLGYSPDGRYFAFEQFGIQDGSGFAYAEIFLIDLDTDRFALGSPFRARIEEEPSGLDDARDAVRAMAGTALADITVPARPLVVHADGEIDPAPRDISFALPGFGLDDTGEPHALSLEVFGSTSPLDCEDWFGGPAQGYALTLEAPGQGAELHRDSSVPRSRNCTADYRIHSIHIPFADWSLASAVAVISVWSHGFEGLDRRFIALPATPR